MGQRTYKDIPSKKIHKGCLGGLVGHATAFDPGPDLGVLQ